MSLDLRKSKVTVPLQFWNRKEFECSRCALLYKAPIYWTSECGDICNGCLTGLHGFRMHNKRFEDALLKIHISCGNREWGCCHVQSVLLMRSHEEVCPYRELDCPLLCGISMRNNIEEHYKVYHPDRIVNTKHMVASLGIPINEMNVDFLLIISKYNKFLIRLDIKPELFAVLPYSIYDVDPNLLTVVGNVGTYEQQIPMIPFSKHFVPVVKQEMKFERHLLPTRETNVELQLTVILESDVDVESILETMRCVNCDLFIRPPAMHCPKKHNTCLKCSLRRLKCYVCSEPFDVNFALDRLARTIYYPCRFNCHQSYTVANIKSHEAHCPLEVITCPMCPLYRTTQRELLQHVYNEHATLIGHDYYRFSANITRLHFIIHEEQIFLVDVLDFVWDLNEPNEPIRVCVEILGRVVRKNYKYRMVLGRIGEPSIEYTNVVGKELRAIHYFFRKDLYGEVEIFSDC